MMYCVTVLSVSPLPYPPFALLICSEQLEITPPPPLCMVGRGRFRTSSLKNEGDEFTCTINEKNEKAPKCECM